MDIPPYSSWPVTGLPGKIGRGLLSGMWVLAEKFADVDGPEGYRLWLPEPDVDDPDTGEHLTVSMREGDSPNDELSFIHQFTRVLDVSWTISQEESIAARDWLNDRFEINVSQEPRDMQKHLRRLGFR